MIIACGSHEMFAPIVAVRGVDGRGRGDAPGERCRAGFDRRLLQRGRRRKSTGSWINIEAGVLYVNRATGATTGAWPGYQSFGGWKGSTGSNKASGSYYYLQQYMREQSHTIVG